MLTFSQRKGLQPVRTIIQIDSADQALRNLLWNNIDWNYWVLKKDYFNSDPVSTLLRRFWIYHYKLIHADLPSNPISVIYKIRNDFIDGSWDTMYSILEFIPNNYLEESLNDEFVKSINLVLEKHLSGYRFVGKLITDITSEEEIESIENSLRDTASHKPVQDHLKRALELMSDRQNPDYRNSIKESISAIESLCCIITENPKATLGQALAKIEKSHSLHSALKSSFTNLYGWTSDADGIRHKMIEQSQVKPEDAKFMIITCSAFVNYIISKIN